MKYSFVLATLAAAAIATPYINVEVSDENDLAVIENHNRDHRQHDGVRRHHRNNRDRRDRDREDRDDENNNGWFSNLWRKNNRDHEHRTDDPNNRRGPQDRGHRRHGRDNGRNDRNRDLYKQLFGSDYECILQSDSGHEERRGADNCCRQVGGEQYDAEGRCVFRDVIYNPRDDWRTCALEQRGVNFADCYYREQREIEDELDQSRRRHNDRDSSNSRHRNGADENKRNRSHREDRDRSGRRNDRDHHQRVLGGNNDNNGRNGRNSESQIECRLNLNDESRERDITRQCCNDQDVRGRLSQNDQRCQIRRDDNADEFEDCALEQGIEEEQVECYRRDRNEEL